MISSESFQIKEEKIIKIKFSYFNFRNVFHFLSIIIEILNPAIIKKNMLYPGIPPPPTPDDGISTVILTMLERVKPKSFFATAIK